MTQVREIGLAGCGRSGEFDVAVDSIQAGDQKGWQLEIECRSWCFRFDLNGTGTVAALAEFLQMQNGQLKFGELELGMFHGAKVLIIKDDEFDDRFFLRASDEASETLVRFTLVDGAGQHLATAARQAADDLE